MKEKVSKERAQTEWLNRGSKISEGRGRKRVDTASRNLHNLESIRREMDHQRITEGNQRRQQFYREQRNQNNNQAQAPRQTYSLLSSISNIFSGGFFSQPPPRNNQTK